MSRFNPFKKSNEVRGWEYWRTKLGLIMFWAPPIVGLIWTMIGLFMEIPLVMTIIVATSVVMLIGALLAYGYYDDWMVTNRRLLLMFIRMWETQSDFERFEDFLWEQVHLGILSTKACIRLKNLYNKQI